MDDVTLAIAEFATGGRTTPDDVVGSITSHIVDAMGCAIAALDEIPCRIVHAAVREGEVSRGSSVIGLEGLYPPDQAAFANACLVRNLDYNDTYNSTTGGHPSDMIPGIFAAVEAAGGSGKDLIHGVDVAYEVFGALADTVPLRDYGWDQGVFIAIGCAAGIAAGVGLSLDAASNAISLAVTSSNGLRVTRSGNLSAWKGCATPHAVRNAVSVARLATLGMTGPDRPFSGPDGFLERVGGPIEVKNLGVPRNGRSAVQRTAVKFLPVEWCAQAPVELFLELHHSLDLAGVEAIEVAGYDFLCKEIGGGRGDAVQKWDPRTRETADHSMPYLLAVALVDGAVNIDSFLPERINDPALRPLMQKISVVEDPATRGIFPQRQPVTISITLRDGRMIRRGCEYPLGHPERPATDGDVDAKFLEVSARTIQQSFAEEILFGLRGISLLPNLEPVARLLRSVRSRAHA